MKTLLRAYTRAQAFFASLPARKRFGFAAAGVLSALILVALPSRADACGLSDIGGCVALIFIKIFQLLTALMGYILIMEVDGLIRASQYANFVSPGPTAVQIGWVVTRDLANMFFIVFLLIIAFSTIIGVEKYSYRNNLRTLLIMAVVINFSKTITGIFIDMSQVLMLTFVNGFKAAAAGNFLSAFGIPKLLSLGDSPAETFGMVLAMMLAFVLVTIAVSVVLVMLVMLVFRVIMLWILVILSPIAFLTRAFPIGTSYYAQWWGELKKYLTSGPLIAFFLWLALASAQKNPNGLAGEQIPGGGGWAAQSTASVAENQAASQIQGSRIPSEAGTTDTILSMVIVTCIMFAGLKFAAQSGVAGAGFAGQVKGKIAGALRASTIGVAGAVGGYAAGRAKEGALRGAGMFANVPLIGGLSRMAAMRGEAMQKQRQAGRERLFGSPEDVARLSPRAYGAKIQSLTKSGNTKELDRWMKAGLANPDAAKRLDNPHYGADAMQSMIQNSKPGKQLQDSVGMLMSDKRATSWAKVKKDENGNVVDPVQADAAKSLLTSTYAKLEQASKDDPNMKKTFGDFKQKFAPQLSAEDVGLLKPDELKNIVPKMSSDDIAGLGAGDMATFMPNMNAGQLKKLAQDGTPEQQKGMLEAYAKMSEDVQKDVLNKMGASDIPASWYKNGSVADSVLDRTKGDAKARAAVIANDKEGDLANRAQARLATALAGSDNAAIVAALPDAISVGKLTAGEINSNSTLKSAVKERAGQVDLQSLGRNVSISDTTRTDAGKALAALVGDAVPDKIRNARKSGMLEHVLPTVAESEARTQQAKAVQGADLRAEAPNLIQDLGRQLATLEASAASAPSEAATEEISRLRDSIQGLTQQVSRRDEALKSLEGMRDRIGLANSGTLAMPAPELDALKRAAGDFEKRLDQLDNAISKTVADIKGQKFDAGPNGNRNRNRRNA